MALQMEDSKWYGQVGRRSVELQEMVRGVQFMMTMQKSNVFRLAQAKLLWVS